LFVSAGKAPQRGFRRVANFGISAWRKVRREFSWLGWVFCPERRRWSMTMSILGPMGSLGNALAKIISTSARAL